MSNSCRKLFDINTGISNSSNLSLTETCAPQLVSAEAVVRQATTDEQVIALLTAREDYVLLNLISRAARIQE